MVCRRCVLSPMAAWPGKVRKGSEGRRKDTEDDVSVVCVCYLPIHSGHQVCWTYQPGSHRKVTQDFSSTFLLRCAPCFSREKDLTIPFLRRPWSRIMCTNDLIVLHLLGIFFFFFFF